MSIERLPTNCKGFASFHRDGSETHYAVMDDHRVMRASIPRRTMSFGPVPSNGGAPWEQADALPFGVEYIGNYLIEIPPPFVPVTSGSAQI